ncbi:helix-turn-helix domain-containing protein [Chromobacterium violaceum]|uniref:helix-turn-helix domain-containing protein n=1 Tax=Chromobacterium violaceum TaxID=536 RepID=UPI0015FB8B6D|nr:helix-turn-helix transcriptional regulator [Chromobacterium violaceum]MBA8735365.1 helix-turn-helix transcriptional regulator [Chromobacterium violaceum]
MKIQLSQSPREIRRQTGLNQQQFWTRIGVTQSGGSRYESGRNIPRPVQTLVNVVHVHGIELEKIDRRNARVVRALLAGEIDIQPLLAQVTAAEERAE